MAILRAKDVKTMDAKTRADKLKDLKMELIKAQVSAHKTNAKTKEIKRAIARIVTFTNRDKREAKKQK